MNHLYQSPDGVIHKCEGGQIAVGDPSTYVVWTKCNKDVPANKSFKSEEVATCMECLQA